LQDGSTCSNFSYPFLSRQVKSHKSLEQTSERDCINLLVLMCRSFNNKRCQKSCCRVVCDQSW
jgi:hypothetical protein